MYMAAANEFTESRIFDSPSLAEIVKRYESLDVR
jgi:hypothetical protein